MSRAVATLVHPLEHECQVHWQTQARCIYHRIIYTNIDIHEKLRYTSNHIQVSSLIQFMFRLNSSLTFKFFGVLTLIQQEANMFDEKKDYRYRGILRRYRKFEEHMTDAGKDRDPDICA